MCQHKFQSGTGLLDLRSLTVFIPSHKNEWGWDGRNGSMGKVLAAQVCGPVFGSPECMQKPGTYICNPGAPLMRWEADTGESLAILGQLAGIHIQQ